MFDDGDTYDVPDSLESNMGSTGRKPDKENENIIVDWVGPNDPAWHPISSFSMYRSNTILGDAQELPRMEEMGHHHNASTDDNLRYFRLVSLQYSNKTNSKKFRCLSRRNGVRCQFVRARLRLWPYYIRPPV